MTTATATPADVQVGFVASSETRTPLPAYERPICGVQAICNRPRGHRGHHGGFRPAGLSMAEVRGVNLGPQEMTMLRTYARLGSHKEVAYETEVSIQTVKNHLTTSYRKLNVSGALQAFTAMGWLRLPDDDDPKVRTLMGAVALRTELDAIAVRVEGLARDAASIGRSVR